MARKRSSQRAIRPELVALLNRCKDEPDDDAPRLILADSPHLANLRVQDLEDNHVGDEGAREFARSPYLPREIDLGLSSNGTVSDDTVAELHERFDEEGLDLDYWDDTDME